MDKKPVILDIGAKEYIDNERRLYEQCKNKWNKRELVSEFLLEFVVVFLQPSTKHRWLVKRAIEENNGCDHYRNAMFIYDVVTGAIPVEYKQLFEEY